MIFTETKLNGAFVLDIIQLEDERGFFGRAWCKREMEENGLSGNIVQSSVSFNKTRGTLRGLHFQKPPFEETKLVRCTKGAIYDVIVDLRKDSSTYLKWFGIELSEKSYKMLYIPKNFAHGFITLEDNSEVFYQMSDFYVPGSADGLRWNDPLLNINWPDQVVVISERDNNYPYIHELKERFSL